MLSRATHVLGWMAISCLAWQSKVPTSPKSTFMWRLPWRLAKLEGYLSRADSAQMVQIAASWTQRLWWDRCAKGLVISRRCHCRRYGGSVLEETVKSWSEVAKSFSVGLLQDRVANLRQKWVTGLPNGVAASDGNKQALVDLSEEAAEVAALCTQCQAEVESLFVQHGSAVHACIGELIRGGTCIVDDGEVVKRLAGVVREAVEGVDMETAMGTIVEDVKHKVGLSQGLLQCDSVHKHIKQAEQHLEAILAIAAQADRLKDLGVEDSLLDNVSVAQPLATAVESLRATMSTRYKMGLNAMEKWATDALIPDFEAVCEEGKRVGTLCREPTLRLLPVLAPKYKTFIDAAADHGVCDETLKCAKDLHVRMRVYIGVAHAVHMIYEEKISGAELKHVAGRLKSLGIWSGMPSCIKKGLQSDDSG